MQTETLKVGGMTCGGCVSAVTKALRAVPGVKDVSVSLQAGEARVDFDESATSPDRLRTAVERAGFDVKPGNAQEPQGRGGCCG